MVWQEASIIICCIVLQLSSLALDPPEGKSQSEVSFFPHYITHLNASHNIILDIDHTLLRLKGLVVCLYEQINKQLPLW